MRYVRGGQLDRIDDDRRFAKTTRGQKKTQRILAEKLYDYLKREGA